MPIRQAAATAQMADGAIFRARAAVSSPTTTSHPPTSTTLMAANAGTPMIDPVARMGWEYVISGASVGARYLLRQVQALGYSADHGASFLAGHAGGDDWPRFLTRLAQAELSPPQRQSLCSAALAAFAAAEHAFLAAYRPVSRIETLA